MAKSNNKKNHGFSLLEISIVLVIMGLVVGGIISGQHLMRSASINGVLSEIDQYQSLVKVFSEKYEELPGDMSDASTYWPTCDATPANCNDNGDGAINDTLPWFHLSLAEIIDTSYPILTGIPIPGEDIPKADMDNNAAYMITYGFPYGKFGNYFTLNRPEATGVMAGVVTSVEAHKIDSKIDDGKSSYGNTVVINDMDSTGTWKTTGCVNGGDLTAAPSLMSWDLTNDSENNCILVFYLN